MKAMGKLMEMVVAELERKPVGAQVTFLSQAIVTMEKRQDGHWEQVKVDSGLKVVSTSYVAGKMPEYD